MEDIARKIAHLQAEIRTLIEDRRDSKLLNDKMAALDHLEAEYANARDRENERLADALRLQDLGMEEPAFLRPSASNPALGTSNAAALARWNSVLTVWNVGQKWKTKAKHSKIIGDATRLLKKLEEKEAVQSEISDLRASLYALRQRKHLNENDAFLKRRLEEQLRIAEADMRAILARDVSTVNYSEEDMKFLLGLESGTVVRLMGKLGKAKPVDQLFTLDPYSGSMLWGDDRDATTITSAIIVDVAWGTDAMLHSKYVPDSQLRYSIKLTVSMAGSLHPLFIVAYTEEEFDLWTRGVRMVVEKLKGSPAYELTRVAQK
jgi:hypothetical protein